MAPAARPCHVVLLAALIWEVRPFLRGRRARSRPGLGLPAWEFGTGPLRGLLALTGMDPAPVRDAARGLLSRVRPNLLISLGFAGALTPETPPGALILGASVWQYDPRRAYLGPIMSPAPPRPLHELLRALQERGLPAAAGSLVSTPVILDKQAHGAAFSTLERPVLDLETAILAGVAASEGLPFLGLRAITDGAGEEIPDFIAGAGGDVSARAALKWVAGDPRRIPALFRLWRRSELAAARLAQALATLLPLLAGSGQELQDQPAQEG